MPSQNLGVAAALVVISPCSLKFITEILEIDAAVKPGR